MQRHNDALMTLCRHTIEVDGVGPCPGRSAPDAQWSTVSERRNRGCLGDTTYARSRCLQRIS